MEAEGIDQLRENSVSSPQIAKQPWNSYIISEMKSAVHVALFFKIFPTSFSLNGKLAF